MYYKAFVKHLIIDYCEYLLVFFVIHTWKFFYLLIVFFFYFLFITELNLINRLIGYGGSNPIEWFH